MRYSMRLLSDVPKKKLKKTYNDLLVENNDFVLPISIPSFLSDAECDRILSIGEREMTTTGVVGNVGVTDLRKSQVGWVYPDTETEWLFKKLDALAIQVNRKYRFDLLGFFQGAQIATYTDGGHYGWHIDIGKGNQSNRKLSISVQLSREEDYEGGDLEFMCISQKAPKQRGTAIVFPAFLMHRVNPVTSGARKSLVSWISGEPFR